MDKVYRTALNHKVTTFTGNKAKQLQHHFYEEVQESILVQMRVAEKEKQLHVKPLAVQGNSLELMATEQNDVTWKSYMFNLKSGTLKFLLNASIDTLPKY